MTEFVEHPVLGRRIRAGSWQDQGVATYRLIGSALDDGRWAEAVELARYFVVEAEVCHRLFRQWLDDLRGFLRGRGMTGDDLRAADERIAAVLVLPDGTPWDPGLIWQRFLRQVDAFVAHAEGKDPAAAEAALEDFTEAWRCCHDRDVDHMSGLIDEVIQRYGEATIGPMYDDILVPWFEARYSVFDVDKHPWAEALRLNMLVAFEAMRGHLCGPGRRGDVEFEDLPDRYVLRFDPCGSGGRSTRGDAVEGTPPRMEAPYGWQETREPAPWNHYRPGVCTYCAHCIVLTEIMPTDAFGYPTRAVDPPRYGDGGKCAWTMFKDPAAVPDEYYTRIGRTRPAAIGSIANGGKPKPAAGEGDR